MTTDNDAAKALDRLENDVETFLGRDRKFLFDAIRAELAKSAKVDEDSMPCVSCGKPSQVSTPDDAEMCHECFGQFNATEYDLLKKQVGGLLEALKFYADPQNQAKEYTQSGCGITFDHGSAYSNDKGERARLEIQRFNGEV